ncbi:MAG: hypothetical protein HYX80_03715 [Chloroflexi bacterium]|nr:hypothetical protein [Chloroflexota bacterium]
MTELKTMQDAAYEILKEMGHPLSSKELARIALARRLVNSQAENKIQSLANTIEKNIRDAKYNNPELIPISSSDGTLIGLPEHKNVIGSAQWWEKISINVPLELFQKLQLAQQARQDPTLENTMIFLLQSGLKSESTNIKQKLQEQIEKF